MESVAPRSFSSVVLALALLAFPNATARSAPPLDAPVPVVTIPGARGVSEIEELDEAGAPLRRFKGFSFIWSVQRTRAGELTVYEAGRHRVVTFDRSGTVRRVWPLREDRTTWQATLLPDEHVLAAMGRDGVEEIDKDGRTVWRASTARAVGDVVSAVRLGDGATLCIVVANSRARFQWARAGATRLEPLATPASLPADDPQFPPRLRLVDAAARNAVVSCPSWPRWYEFAWGGKSIEKWSEGSPLSGIVDLTPDGAGGLWAATEQFAIVGVSPSGEERRRLPTAYVATGLDIAENGGLFLSFDRTPDARLSAKRAPSPNHAPLSWSRLFVWFLATVIFLTGLQVFAWRRASRAHEGARAGSTLAAGGWAEGGGSPGNGLRLACAGAAAAGLLVAAIGWPTVAAAGLAAAPVYLTGALLAGLAVLLWVRRTGVSRTWWRAVREARPEGWLLLPTVAVAAVLVAGGTLLLRWTSSGTRQGDSICLWVALQVLVLGFAAISPKPPRARTARFSLETLLHVVGLLLLATLVLTRKLDEVPKNVHSDIGHTIASAMRVFEGRFSAFFSGGYAYIPNPGSLPASLGFLLKGETVSGARLGSVLVAITAVLGTCLLGREWRNARLGLFAGILLTASIIFIHFSRSTPFGEVVPLSVWMLYGFVRAVRTARPGPWLVTGLLGGWGLLLFYSARVAVLGVILAGVVLALRSPRVTLRRWWGPLLFAIGFGVAVVPMIPYWSANPGAFLHRMDDSFDLYGPAAGFHPEVLRRAAGAPLAKTFGMFFTEANVCDQGTVSPAAGPIEATLLLIGVFVAATEGWGVNVACLTWFLTMLLGCGAFAHATPGYHRLVAVIPVASLFMALALDSLAALLPARRPLVAQALTVALSALLVGGLVFRNLGIYLRREQGLPATEFTAFGKAAIALGPSYQFYCLNFQRPDFTCEHGSFVPFLANLDVSDLRDLSLALPFPAGRPVAVLVPYARFIPHAVDARVLLGRIVHAHPAARLLPVPPHGTIVLVGVSGGDNAPAAPL